MGQAAGGLGEGGAPPGHVEPPAGHEHRVRVVDVTVVAAPASVREVRELVRSELAADDVDEDRADLVTLLTSELVTNAIRYASSERIGVRLQLGASIEVAVHDDDARTPQVRTPALLDVRGRGLVLVTGLAQAWGIRASTAGKWGWFRV